MGTNFYVVFKKEGHTFEMFHLGKRSGGWKFLWHGFMENCTVKEIKKFLRFLERIDGFCIQDEYGTAYCFDEFITIVYECDKANKRKRGKNIEFRHFS